MNKSVIDLMNKTPDAIDFHDSTILLFLQNQNFIFLRYAIGLDLDVVDGEVDYKNFYEDKENDFIIIDQVFYKPKIIESNLDRVIKKDEPIESLDNLYKDGHMYICFEIEFGEDYSILFDFEKEKTKLYKIINAELFYKLYNDFESELNCFNIDEFEKREECIIN